MGDERMKIMKVMKRLDVIIIGLLLVVSFVPYLMFKNKNKDIDTSKLYAIVTVNGKVLAEIDLSAKKDDEFLIETSEGNNKIVVHDGGISIVEADCSDGVCVHQGVAKRAGDMIVCLPHRVIIEVVGTDNGDKDQDVISQ